jgi:hypothetical protein
MIKHLRIAGLAMIVSLVALSSVALTPPTHLSQGLTPPLTIPVIVQSTPTSHSAPAPTPGKIRPTPVPSITQAGNSDRIVLIGILIVGIIVVPILLRRKEWGGN